MVSTRRRCRLFRPWIVKPCSRVLRKFSGELTTIQYWAERPPSPDLRFRRDRDRTGRSASDFCAWTCCSDTPEGYWPVRSRRRRPEVLRLGREGAGGAGLDHVRHLVARDPAADVEQRV